MGKYTDDEIREMKKITCKIAADYLGISPMAVSIGLYKGITGIFPRIDLFSKNARMQDFPPPLVFALLETKSLRIEWYGGFSKGRYIIVFQM